MKVPTVFVPSLATIFPVGAGPPLVISEVTLATEPFLMLTGALASVADAFLSSRTLESFAGASVVQGTVIGSGPAAVEGVNVKLFGRVMS